MRRKLAKTATDEWVSWVWFQSSQQFLRALFSFFLFPFLLSSGSFSFKLAIFRMNKLRLPERLCSTDLSSSLIWWGTNNQLYLTCPTILSVGHALWWPCSWQIFSSSGAGSSLENQQQGKPHLGFGLLLHKKIGLLAYCEWTTTWEAARCRLEPKRDQTKWEGTSGTRCEIEHNEQYSLIYMHSFLTSLAFSGQNKAGTIPGNTYSASDIN